MAPEYRIADRVEFADGYELMSGGMELHVLPQPDNEVQVAFAEGFVFIKYMKREYVFPAAAIIRVDRAND